MNVRGWGFSCQIPLSLVQRGAAVMKSIFPQPAESREKMLHPNSTSLFARVAHTLVLLQHCSCCPSFTRFPDAFFIFPGILSMQQPQPLPRQVTPMSEILSPVPQQHTANRSTAQPQNQARPFATQPSSYLSPKLLVSLK